MTVQQQDANEHGRTALERFIVENDDLLTIESRIGKFNVFDALGITRAEIRHSNFLAFILDPAESHGQGQLFLKAILMDILKNALPTLRPLSPIDLDGTDLRGIEIKREWNNINLLITCKDPRFVVVVENKVGTHDHSGQLNRYSEQMTKCYPDLIPLYVFLTPDGDDPSEETKVVWQPYTYADIHRVFKRIRATYLSAIGTDVLVFLDHYLSLLGTRFMNDQELDELCRRIYKKHRQALDLIWNRVGSPDLAPLIDLVNLLEQDSRWHVLYQSTKYVEFVPSTWLEWLPPFGPEDYHPFSIHVRLKESNLGSSIFVGPMEDVAKRKEIVTKLRQECPKLGFKPSKAIQTEGKWSRISAVEQFLDWSEEDAPEPATTGANLKKMLEILYLRLEKLGSYLKSLYNDSPSSAKSSVSIE